MHRRVLVLNHFAVSDGAPGGTRHVEMFGRLGDGWDASIIAADRNLFDVVRSDGSNGSIRLVPTTPYRSNGLARVLNWVTYSVSATVIGTFGRRPDVVYASSPHLLAGLAGLTIARIRRATFVLEIRDLWPQILVDMGGMSEDSFVVRLLQRLEQYLYTSADAIVVLAWGTRTKLNKRLDPGKTIVWLPNGADMERFADCRPNQDTEIVEFVYAGAHGPANGLDLLISAARSVQDEGLPVRIRLVGGGIEKESLVAMAKAENVTSVVFQDPIAKSAMPGVLERAQVGLHVLADVDLFRYGVSPNKLFEYMAAGLPVITNCPGEVADIVVESGSGIATTPDGLESAICEMALMDPAERAAMGERGRAFVGEHRARDVLARELRDFLDGLVE